MGIAWFSSLVDLGGGHRHHYVAALSAAVNAEAIST
jgi:hypothetical protein